MKCTVRFNYNFSIVLSIIEVGNYNDTIHSMVEDFDLILRVLKKFGKIYNLPNCNEMFSYLKRN